VNSQNTVNYIRLALLTLLENLWRKRRQAALRQAVVSGIAGLLTIPLLVYFLPAQIRRVNDIPLISADWSLRQDAFFLVQSIGNTFLYSLIGWPTSTIPRWLGIFVLASVAVLALLVWRYLPGRLFAWLIATYAVYFILVRTRFYVGGFRYGLIFTPFFILVLTAVTERLWRYRSAVIALVLLCLVVGTELYSLPNPTITRQIRGRPSWLPVEQMEDVFAYWKHHRRADEATFVYYAAVPAFRYYLHLYDVDGETRSSDLRLNVECNARRTTQLCAEKKLFYGSWSRELSPQEKIANMEATLGGKPKRLWLLFSHVHADEEKEMIQQLRESYQIVHHYGQDNAAAYLLILAD
jgi:hypothetical protein